MHVPPSIKLPLAPEQVPEKRDAPPLTGAEYGLAAIVAVVLLAIASASQLIDPSPLVHRAAQFVHLACVVVGLGSVIVVDWFGLLWRFGRKPLKTVLDTASVLAVPIWFGFGGLLMSGMFLSPDLSSPLTRVKIGMVALAGVGGVLALALGRRLSSPRQAQTARLLRTALIVAVMSQLCWWTAAVIGFLNRT